MAAVIETHELTKVYGKHKAVDSLTFEVEQGEIFGFLGPNGAGKTTTILMLLGLAEPTSGSSCVLGFDPVREPLKVKQLVGCMPENVGFYHDMTARENLAYVARLNQVSESEAKSRIDGALEKVKLADEADKLLGAYSRGMRQRLGIAEVLIKHKRFAIGWES
jgi:ABC-2 type transport system ATP-binding protein